MSSETICSERQAGHGWIDCRVKQLINGREMFVTGCMFCGVIESIKPALGWEAWIKYVRPAGPMTVGSCPGCGGLRKELYIIRGLFRCARCIRFMKKKPDKKRDLYEVPTRR